jgi:hypothetical protein
MRKFKEFNCSYLFLLILKIIFQFNKIMVVFEKQKKKQDTNFEFYIALYLSNYK